MQRTADIQKLSHKYLPTDFVVTDWASLEPFFKELNDRPISSVEALEAWLTDLSELEACISEDACWRQVRMTCDTENKALEEAFNFFLYLGSIFISGKPSISISVRDHSIISLILEELNSSSNWSQN